MNSPLPTVVRCRVNKITLEICHGNIPDIFRQLRFGSTIEFKLPDTKVTDEEFQKWLEFYRHINPWLAPQLLEKIQCN